ncbi:uncharacterized protein NEMAJ01_2244 [Nematocida major]|uniref:uncharacterized protein n=1 Tax=Nematocida major TaxID=1912982 RepID=UPI0020085F4A|nr:uncharacterized protein NEMAJ01_2226 [Nematocida major]XP_047772039.1 uncharacterized protein NEMAJ01_2244 [Nematocida major]KAH9387330.1 hypothetical protein NEMAJ01_2226 [Nematocida major]KAH9387348.1 hypothetical protein NEMAJ01_2244 [Nematocida major]
MDWSQTYREVTVRLPLDKKSRDRVRVRAGSSLLITKNEEVLVDRELFLGVDGDETVWTLDEGCLEVSMRKREMGPWKSLFKGDPEEEQDLPVENVSLSDLGEEAQSILEKAIRDGNMQA